MLNKKKTSRFGSCYQTISPYSDSILFYQQTNRNIDPKPDMYIIIILGMNLIQIHDVLDISRIHLCLLYHPHVSNNVFVMCKLWTVRIYRPWPVEIFKAWSTDVWNLTWVMCRLTSPCFYMFIIAQKKKKFNSVAYIRLGKAIYLLAKKRT